MSPIIAAALRHVRSADYRITNEFFEAWGWGPTIPGSGYRFGVLLVAYHNIPVFEISAPAKLDAMTSDADILRLFADEAFRAQHGLQPTARDEDERAGFVPLSQLAPPAPRQVPALPITALRRPSFLW